MAQTSKKQLILASGSPRRKELLSLLGVPFVAWNPEGKESVPADGEGPEEATQRIAMDKAWSLGKWAGDELVLAADTLVVFDGRLIGKPANSYEAVEILQRLRGVVHEVVTGVVLMLPSKEMVWGNALKSSVKMRFYSDEEVRQYVDSGDPMDKAGGYGIQNPCFAPADWVDGCYLNVIGLPVCLTSRLLALTGLDFEGITEQTGGWCRGCCLGSNYKEK